MQRVMEVTYLPCEDAHRVGDRAHHHLCALHESKRGVSGTAAARDCRIAAAGLPLPQHSLCSQSRVSIKVSVAAKAAGHSPENVSGRIQA